jgi:hypothetical protein
LLDTAVLQDMEDQLGGTGLAWNFANDYAGMWLERHRSLVDSLHGQATVKELLQRYGEREDGRR